MHEHSLRIKLDGHSPHKPIWLTQALQTLRTAPNTIQFSIHILPTYNLNITHLDYYLPVLSWNWTLLKITLILIELAINGHVWYASSTSVFYSATEDWYYPSGQFCWNINCRITQLRVRSTIEFSKILSVKLLKFCTWYGFFKQEKAWRQIERSVVLLGIFKK